MDYVRKSFSALLFSAFLLITSGAEAQVWKNLNKMDIVPLNSSCPASKIGTPAISTGGAPVYCNGSTYASLQTGGGSNTLTSATSGGACPVPGAQGYDSAGATYVCVNNVWKSLGAATGGSYVIRRYYGTCGYPNPLVGGCSCPSGYTASPISYATSGGDDFLGYLCFKYY